MELWRVLLPLGLWRKGTKLCVFTYSPYNSLHVAVTCALLPLGYNPSKIQKCGLMFFAQQSPWSSPFTDDLFWIRTLSQLLFCILSVELNRAEDQLSVSQCGRFGTILQSNCCKTPRFFLWMDSTGTNLRLRPRRFHLSERDTLEVLLKRVNVFVHTCVFWVNLCVYTG